MEDGKRFLFAKNRSKTLSGHFSTIKPEVKSPQKPPKTKIIQFHQAYQSPKRKFFNSPQISMIN